MEAGTQAEGGIGMSFGVGGGVSGSAGGRTGVGASQTGYSSTGIPKEKQK